MKLIAKQMLVALALLVAVPSFAAEGPTKGTKSYQKARSEQPDAQTQENAQEPTTAEDAAQMAPAAGDTAETPAQSGQTKTMREDMRLPRKN